MCPDLCLLQRGFPALTGLALESDSSTFKPQLLLAASLMTRSSLPDFCEARGGICMVGKVPA